MASSFGPEGPSSIPDAAKDPSSKCGVLAHKIRGSESPVVGRQQFTMGIVSGKNFPPFQRHIKIEEVDDEWCCHLSYNEAEIGLLLQKNRPHITGVTYLPCLKPCTGLGLQVAHVNNNYYSIRNSITYTLQAVQQ